MDQLDRWTQSMAEGTFDLSLLDDDVVIWHSYDGLDMTLDEERALVESTHETVTAVRAIGIKTRRHHCGALVEYVLRVKMRDDSKHEIPAFALVRTEGGRITRIEEYRRRTGRGPQCLIPNRTRVAA